MEEKVYESDLFEAVKRYFEKIKYTVKAEIKDCDVVAIKDDEIIIIEMKKNLNLSLLSQAFDRQRISDIVYIAILRPKRLSKSWKKYTNLIKRLELGLIYVDVKTDIAEIIFHPKEYKISVNKKRKNNLLKEFNERISNYNIGGVTGKKIVTAYKENAIFIAAILYRNGAMSAKELKKYGTGDKTYSIIYKNHELWFEKIEKGLYGLSKDGVDALEQYKELHKYYIEKILEKEREE